MPSPARAEWGTHVDDVDLAELEAHVRPAQFEWCLPLQVERRRADSPWLALYAVHDELKPAREVVEDRIAEPHGARGQRDAQRARGA
jgi:hypothetical protein